MASKTRDGVTCKCGTFTPFGVWVFAHMDILITFICPQCKTVYAGMGRYGGDSFEEVRNEAPLPNPKAKREPSIRTVLCICGHGKGRHSTHVMSTGRIWSHCKVPGDDCLKFEFQTPDTCYCEVSTPDYCPAHNFEFLQRQDAYKTFQQELNEDGYRAFLKEKIKHENY